MQYKALHAFGDYSCSLVPPMLYLETHCARDNSGCLVTLGCAQSDGARNCDCSAIQAHKALESRKSEKTCDDNCCGIALQRASANRPCNNLGTIVSSFCLLPSVLSKRLCDHAGRLMPACDMSAQCAQDATASNVAASNVAANGGSDAKRGSMPLLNAQPYQCRDPPGSHVPPCSHPPEKA